MKKPFGLAYGFKSPCKSFNERFSELEDFLQYKQKNQRNIFPPFGNGLLPPSRNITLKVLHIIYPLKQKDICDYNPRCLMSILLMFDYIIMNILRNKSF